MFDPVALERAQSCKPGAELGDWSFDKSNVAVPNGGGVMGKAVAASNDGRIWLVGVTSTQRNGNGGGMLRSDDYGRSFFWQQMGTGGNPGVFSIESFTGQKPFLGLSPQEVWTGFACTVNAELCWGVGRRVGRGQACAAGTAHAHALLLRGRAPQVAPQLPTAPDATRRGAGRAPPPHSGQPATPSTRSRPPRRTPPTPRAVPLRRALSASPPSTARPLHEAGLCVEELRHGVGAPVDRGPDGGARVSVDRAQV